MIYMVANGNAMENFRSISNRTKNFILEKPRNKRLETFPKAFLPKCWNAVSLDHKNKISNSSFKKYIREDLINEYDEFTCTNNNCSSCSI